VRHRMEREREPVLVIDEHALGHEEVEVHVEVERSAAADGVRCSGR
jgi:hypothetical protein